MSDQDRRAVRVSVSKTYGSYDLLSNDKEWELKVTVYPSDNWGKPLTVSQLFDEEPYADRPSEALDDIEERLNRPLYFTGRKKEYNETIAKMREMDLDRVWLDQEIAHYEKKLKQLCQERGDA